MIASAHLAAGFVVGMTAAYLTPSRIPRIVTAFGLGLLSHVALDTIPHGDYRPLSVSVVSWVGLCEMVVICTIGGLIVRRRVSSRWPEYLVPGLLGACLLDAKFIARIVLPEDVAFSVAHYGNYLHSFFHAGRMRRPEIGWGIEIVTSVMLLTLLLVFPTRTQRTQDARN